MWLFCLVDKEHKKIRKNIKKGVRVDGQEIDLGMPRLNPGIANDIIEWVKKTS